MKFERTELGEAGQEIAYAENQTCLKAVEALEQSGIGHEQAWEIVLSTEPEDRELIVEES